jgi:glycosyltransferase involved in cell wall biosynthesis
MPRPRKVLIVSHHAGIGGAELSMEAFVINMPPERCQYTVAMPGRGMMADRLIERGIPVIYMPLESWRWWEAGWMSRVKLLLTLPLFLHNIWRWVRYLRQNRPELIHFNINTLVEPVIAANILRIPSVMHFRDIPTRRIRDFFLGRAGFDWLMNRADHWIANSTMTYEDIREHTTHPVDVFLNGFDLAAFDQEAGNSRTEKTPGKIRIAMVAFLMRWKNHPDFLRVAKLVCERCAHVRFLIAGNGSPEYTAELKALSRELGIEEQVEFVGFVENIPKFLVNDVDILLHTCPTESFGRVMAEAMAASLPVVAYRSGGAVDVVADQETGFLIPPGDLPAMCDALIRLIEDDDLRKRMGSAGRQRVETHFTVRRLCEQLADLYDLMAA